MRQKYNVMILVFLIFPLKMHCILYFIFAFLPFESNEKTKCHENWQEIQPPKEEKLKNSHHFLLEDEKFTLIYSCFFVGYLSKTLVYILIISFIFLFFTLLFLAKPFKAYNYHCRSFLETLEDNQHTRGCPMNHHN